jgi:hypothetical protein
MKEIMRNETIGKNKQIKRDITYHRNKKKEGK